VSVVHRVVHAAGDLWSEGRGPTLLAVAGAWFLALGTRLAVPAVLPYVRADLGIDNAAAGLLVTTLWVAYALTQFPSGLLTDRLGERRLLAGSMFLGAVAVLLLGVTGGPVGLAAGVLLFGFGTGLFATPRVMVVSRLYPDRATTALGVVFAAGNVGNTVLPALAGVVAAAAGWRAGFLGLAPLFVLAALGLRAALSDHDPTDAPDDGRATPDVAAALADLRGRPVGFATAALVLFAFAYQGLVGFLPTYLVDAKGLAPGSASLLFGVFFASGLVAQLAAGGLADRHGRRPVLVVTLVAALVATLALTLADGVPLLAGVVVLLGVQIGFWPVMNAYAYDVLPAGSRGGAYGLVRTVYLCLGATAPLVVGALFDANRYDGAFLVLGSAFGLVLLACAALPVAGRSAAGAESGAP